MSEAHTATLASVLGFDPSKAFLIYPELGNIGPASVPIVLSKAEDAGRLHPGDRVVLAGIGSGLNCDGRCCDVVAEKKAYHEDRRRLYPFAGQDARPRRGVRMHYLDEGPGEPVVMLHGNPTWSFYYRDLVRGAARRLPRRSSPDHIGCGLSDKPDDDALRYTLEPPRRRPGGAARASRRARQRSRWCCTTGAA